MKKAILVFVIVSITIAFLGCTQAQPPKDIKWEYKITSIPDANFTQDINKLGDEGWELVFARRASGGGGEFSYEMIFKRPKKETDKK
jgi:hypothetical protein